MNAKYTHDQARFEDFFSQKVELAEDRKDLIMGEISARDRLLEDNITRIYDDLLRVQNWRLARPFPHSYATDKTWSDLNKMELDLRDQLRRERTQAAIENAMSRAKDKMEEVFIEFSDRYDDAEDDARKNAIQQEIAEELRKYAKEHGLLYAETGLRSRSCRLRGAT